MIFIKKQNSNTKNDFWIGYSDLMTGLMLVFIVLALTFMAIARQKIDDTEESKNKIEDLLKESEKNRIKMTKLIKKLKESNKNIQKTKQNIILILSEKLESHNIKFEYDSIKGTVSIAQDILFEIEKSDLNNEGKNFIDLFSKIINKNILNDSNYRDLIKYIHIEGYASSDGSLEHNFNLSYERAKNVWMYMIYNNTPKDANNLYTKNINKINLSNKSFSKDLQVVLNGYSHELEIMKQKLNIVSRGEIGSNQFKIDNRDRKVVFRFEFYDTYDKLFKGLSK